MDDLIDIDLVKGSTFSKTKSKLSITHVLFNGVNRLVFLPFFLKWWSFQTSKLFSGVLLVLYLMQISNLYIYNNSDFILSYKQKNVNTNPKKRRINFFHHPFLFSFSFFFVKLITFVEIVSPLIIMLALGIMFTYITSALPSNNENDNK